MPPGGVGEAWTRGPALLVRATGGDPDLTAAVLTAGRLVPHRRSRPDRRRRLRARRRPRCRHDHPRRRQRLARRGRSRARAAPRRTGGRGGRHRGRRLRRGGGGRRRARTVGSAGCRPAAAHCAERLAGYKVPSRFVAVSTCRATRTPARCSATEVVGAAAIRRRRRAASVMARLRVAAAQLELRAEPDFDHFAEPRREPSSTEPSRAEPSCWCSPS